MENLRPMSTDAFGHKKDAFAVVQPKAPESPRESLRDSQSQSEDPPALQAEHLPDLQSSPDAGDPLEGQDHDRRVGVIRTRFASRLEASSARV
jgi:hypothetical protein